MTSRDPGPVPEWELRFVERLAGVINELSTRISRAQEASAQNTTRLIDALKDHAGALSASGQASERHAKNLVVATWALAVATFCMAVGVVVQIFVLVAQLQAMK